MVVEHDIADAKALHRVDQPGGLADQMGFGPDLHPQVGDGIGAKRLHRRKQGFAGVRAPVPALPAPALGQIGGGHALRRRLAVKRGQTRRQGKICRGARGHVMFEPVAMQVDDAGQDQEAGEIDFGQGPLHQPPLSQRDRARLHLAVAQNIGTSQTQRGQASGHGGHPMG